MKFSVDRCKENVLLKDHVTFKLGGPAELFYEAHTEQEVVDALKYAHEKGIRSFVLGGGSNLVVSDHGIEGMVVKNLASDTCEIDHEKGTIKLSTGRKLSDLLKVALENELAGLEYLTGIPGTLGGAIYGNAGAYGKCIGDVLIEADILFPDGTVKTVSNSFFEFSYRNSNLKKSDNVVLNATIKVAKGTAPEIKAKMDDIQSQRDGKHPPRTVGCAGSFFKNLPPLPGHDRRRAAGAVLEEAGAKQMTCGGASVFEKHANFIINNGNATAEDVRKLAIMLKDKVQKDFGIELNEEVLYVGK